MEFSRPKNFGVNLLVYEGWHKHEQEQEKPKLFFKVTDYKKGYWAETPLEDEELRELIDHLESYLKEKRETGLE